MMQSRKYNFSNITLLWDLPGITENGSNSSKKKKCENLTADKKHTQ
jgi:hypothetical protein